MITGDQALTACHVAGQVNIITKPPLILTTGKNGGTYDWVSPDEAQTIGYRYVDALLYKVSFLLHYSPLLLAFFLKK